MTTTTTLKDWFRNTSDSENKKIMLLDGGVSTHLRDLCGQHPKGHPLRADWYPELWSSSLLMTPDGRETILKGHQDWLAAGTQILTTVTYQCGMVNAIVKDETTATQMLADGVQLARQATQHNGKEEDKFVVASMGCYGAALADGSEYTGHYPNIQSEQELQDFHRRKTLTLLQQKPDGIALETVPCVMECRAFIQLMQELQQQDNNDKNCACWISFACRNGHELNDGSKLEEALQAIQELDPEATIIHAIGVNCCDSQHILSLVQIIADFLVSTARRGVIIYPNSGEEWDGQTKEWKQGTGYVTMKMCLQNGSWKRWRLLNVLGRTAATTIHHLE
ncbi:Homocysteine S-methyltransferase 1 [Seminavis robusta]|uniref:Homocysteine S-methyltransferase 1 n=1 Tax=Seminavis robusta TaxID=568900 RepID=A0A9N8HCV0_9STRA|nr:Homocysteine S-methyltransferase 1 [Seminavis robusta]|eukprot:Sro333_g119570.1 Homocysteine S-methyltransferase 1 (336) ;mRNA; r:44278-45285